MYVYIYIYVCVCVYMYVCIYVCVWLCACVYICAYVYVCVYVRTYICTYVCMYVCACMCVYVYGHTCMCNVAICTTTPKVVVYSPTNNCWINNIKNIISNSQLINVFYQQQTGSASWSLTLHQHWLQIAICQINQIKEYTTQLIFDHDNRPCTACLHCYVHSKILCRPDNQTYK